MKKGGLFLILILSLYLAGCGYTTRSLLAPELKSVYVDNFTNKINVSREQTDERMYTSYRPGLEVDITKAIIDRFIFDGNLKIANAKASDLTVKGELIDFRKEALRYDANDNVDEYRILLVCDLELKNTGTDKIIWTEKSFSGEATYRTGGSLAVSESTAIRDATSDLARRVVERVIEAW